MVAFFTVPKLSNINASFVLALSISTVCGITAILRRGGWAWIYMMRFLYRDSRESLRWALHYHSCMSLMMTNVALSLQCCVPRIRAGGLEGRSKGSGSGWVTGDGEKEMGRRKWQREVRNGESERDGAGRWVAGMDSPQ